MESGVVKAQVYNGRRDGGWEGEGGGEAVHSSLN